VTLKAIHGLLAAASRTTSDAARGPAAGTRTMTMSMAAGTAILAAIPKLLDAAGSADVS
jgi:hypothetical protein